MKNIKLQRDELFANVIKNPIKDQKPTNTIQMFKEYLKQKKGEQIIFKQMLSKSSNVPEIKIDQLKMLKLQLQELQYVYKRLKKNLMLAEKLDSYKVDDNSINDNFVISNNWLVNYFSNLYYLYSIEANKVENFLNYVDNVMNHEFIISFLKYFRKDLLRIRTENPILNYYFEDTRYLSIKNFNTNSDSFPIDLTDPNNYTALTTHPNYQNFINDIIKHMENFLIENSSIIKSEKLEFPISKYPIIDYSQHEFYNKISSHINSLYDLFGKGKSDEPLLQQIDKTLDEITDLVNKLSNIKINVQKNVQKVFKFTIIIC